MGNVSIFSGRRAKLLSADGILNSNGTINDFNGVREYILNGHAEVNTTGWATYADAAASRPVDGTGGSPNVTFTRSTTSPLNGSGSFIFTKDAANRQGEGASYNFTIPTTDQAKVLKIEADYIVNSGTFVAGSSTTDSDLIFYLYDVTNAVLIEPSSIKLFSNSSTIADKFSAYFQTASNSTSYRLIIHCASTSASAYSLKFDNISVSPSQYVYGTPITDWQSYTPTAANFGVITNVDARWRRVGSNIEITGRFTSGVTTANVATISLPLGFSVIAGRVGVEIYGHWYRDNAGNPATKTGTLIAASNATAFSLGMLHQNVTGSPFSSLNANLVVASGEAFGFNASVQVNGLSSSVQMSDSADTRVVAFTGQIGSNQALTANTTNMNISATRDSHGAWTGSTYVIPTPGDYQIGGSISITTATSTNFIVYVNGASSAIAMRIAASNSAGNGYTTIPNLKSGDVVSIRADASITTLASTANNISISRISGPSAIAATETIAASYWRSSNQSLTANSTDMVFDSREFDTHLAYNSTTGAYTAPAAGVYKIHGVFTPTGAAANVFLYKSGVSYKLIGGATTTFAGIFSTTVRLTAGESFTLRSNVNVTLQGAALSGIASNINVYRIGL